MRAAILLVVAACNLDKPTLPSDANVRDADTCTSFSSQLDTCQLPPATSAIAISGNATYASGSGMLFIGANPIPVQDQQIVGPFGTIDVLICKSFDIKGTATLRITGSVVGIVSEGSISITGTIDVSDGGAGARTTCAPGAEFGLDGITGGGGGGGGFSSAGGDGSDGAGGIPGGTRGGIEPLTTPIAGGCNGARGGATGAGMKGGDGGEGGGGVFIASKQPITLTGKILAGGAGGKGATDASAGGGGGGSGGTILIESPTTTVATTAVVVANGGGGGEGSAGNLGLDGQDGHDDAMPALGGTGGSIGGDGGNGATGSQGAANGGVANSPTAGGGGGGGGAGYIAIPNATIVVGAVVSPAAGSMP